jgi:thioredoxin reductase
VNRNKNPNPALQNIAKFKSRKKIEIHQNHDAVEMKSNKKSAVKKVPGKKHVNFPFSIIKSTPQRAP